MGCLFRLFLIVFSCFLALAVLAFSAVLAINWAVPWWLEREIHERTGFQVDIGSFEFDPWRGRIEVRETIVENPADWPWKSFVDLAEASIVAHPLEVMSRPYVIDTVTLHVNRVTLARLEDGQTNFDYFREHLELAGAFERADRVLPEIRIRELSFRLDVIRQIDDSGVELRETEIPVEIEVELRDLDSLEAAITAVLAEIERNPVN